jgi:hypothetical protein
LLARAASREIKQHGKRRPDLCRQGRKGSRLALPILQRGVRTEMSRGAIDFCMMGADTLRIGCK